MFKNKTRDVITYQIILAILLALVFVAIALPFWRVIVTAFTPLDVYTKQGVPFFLPLKEWTVEAFSQLLSHPQFPRALLNSAIITLGGAMLSLILTVPLAYGLSIPTLPGRRIILLFVLFTFLFNPGLIPVYLLVTGLKLTDNYLAIILPPAVSVWNTLIMMSFFQGLPDELLPGPA